MWCSLVLTALSCWEVLSLVVDIPHLGKVRGTESSSAWTHRTIHEFRGIHFAQSPSGKTRFKDAEKALPWTGVKDAQDYGQPCPQPGVQSSGPDPEDCLTLDVYTPTSNADAKLPVLVFIHGGGFLSGVSSVHRPDFLLERDVVLVTPQYRLGALGFFQMNTADAPGNVGLTDQVLALQWVRDNVAVFGGDPARVTIAGSSAGGASVSLHMVSARAKGLFHQVIAQSGSALALWAAEENKGEEHSRQVAALAGCDVTASASHIVECMRAVPAHVTVRAVVMHSLADRRDGLMGMGVSQPTVQHHVAGTEPFLARPPKEILESGNYSAVPLLMGVTKHEGIFTLDQSYQYYLVLNGLTTNREFLRDDMVSRMLRMYEVQDNTRVVTDAIRKKYFRERDMGNFTAMIPSLVDFSGVALIRGPSIRQAELNSGHADTYFYSFDYYGAQTLLSSANKTIPIKGGITHGDDTIYLFPRTKTPLNEADTEIAKRMVHLYTNFVIHGNPTPRTSHVPRVPRWPTYDQKSQTWMSLGASAELYSDYRKTFTDARDNGIQQNSNNGGIVGAVTKATAHRMMG